MFYVIVNQKGGVGKTTVAVHLACWLRERGRRVVLLDADVQQASSRWLAEAAPDVPVVVEHDADAIIEQSGQWVTDADDVVADGPGGLAEVSRALLLVADVAIVPVLPGVLDLRAADQAVRVVKQAQKIRSGPPRGLLVLNRVQARTRLSRETMEAAGQLDIPTARTSLSHRQAFADAAGQGSVVWRLGASAHAATEEMTQLLMEVCNG